MALRLRGTGSRDVPVTGFAEKEAHCDGKQHGRHPEHACVPKMRERVTCSLEQGSS
jgi:hypothetical protein